MCAAAVNSNCIRLTSLRAGKLGTAKKKGEALWRNVKYLVCWLLGNVRYKQMEYDRLHSTLRYYVSNMLAGLLIWCLYRHAPICHRLHLCVSV